MSMSEYYDEDWDFEYDSDVTWWQEKGYWTTKDGDHIKFEDLENYHLLNIESLLRSKDKLKHWPEITNEINERGLLDPSVPLVERLKF